MRIPIISLIQRRRSPSGHLVTRRGGTHCSDFHFGCSAVPFPAPNRLFLRRIRPHQRPSGSYYLLIRTSAFTGGALCAPYGAMPCSDLCFGCSAVSFLALNCLFLRRIRPHQRPGGSDYLLIRTSAFTLAPLVARSGGTPCSAPFSF